ncbi:helix-turn-helix transcriptional regulator [Pontibacter sp. G13]|uniref:helix-turn-helix domain-containing protein n=1 Tax=Pontibacter sp. G13 TaxID=3074898 RepID=UPI00288941D0|nr:helix-turn-helix transcriptional regulator [Pontibacter sp. G13]WNJ17493.1 helix-turn-helix transcriptional regulator [Pontibacter sp. G13]
MDQIIHIDSVSQLFEAANLGKPLHPLIGIVDVTQLDHSAAEHYKGVKIASGLYSIFLKDGDCGMRYGRNKYDFQEGVLQFIGPNQIVSATETQAPSTYGFMLVFHPDLIRNFELGRRIHHYNFFNYNVHEALHLSQKEEDTLQEVVKNIRGELDNNIDKHSTELIVTNLQLLLNYSKRYYERQFITRANSHSDIMSQVEEQIKTYFQENLQLEMGIPTPAYIADKVNFSTNYLSDLLKKEMGKSTKDLIDDYTIELAKTELVDHSQTVNEVAYKLGFNYPHYFSRMFKKKTGESPKTYRSHFQG